MYKLATLSLVAAFALSACNGTSCCRRNSKISHDPRAAHAKADTNDDGYVDVEEYHHRITEVYFHGDKDKDGRMTYDETDEVVVFQEDWTVVDTNDDGMVSLHEFVRDRMLDFNDVDTNLDGMLSPDEVVDAYERAEQ